jgi:hypothetical protein
VGYPEKNATAGNQMKLSIISGDSWSVGEWSADCKTVQHGGLAHYLADEQFVINVGTSGSSNRESLLRARNLLFNNPHLAAYENKQIIIFQTEWTRDFPYMDSEDKNYYNQPLTLMHRLISRFYYDLSALSQEWNIDIKVIGGAGDALLIDDFKTIYPGVDVVCQSLTNLLVENSSEITDPIFSMFSYINHTNDFLKLFKKHISDPRQLELLMDEVDRCRTREHIFYKHKQHFYPDGTHPNRSAHKILYDFLKENNSL